MKTKRTFKAGAAGAVLLMSAVGLGAAASVPVASAATAHAAKPKKLSVSNISIGGSFQGDFGLNWIAQQQGFFKQQGLHVTFDNISGQSTAATTSAFLGGAFTLLNNAAANTMIVRQQGAPIEAIFNDNIGQEVEVTINSTRASALHIPAADATPAQAARQIQALKGTHVTIAVSNTTAVAYNDLVAILKLAKVSYGINDSKADVDFLTVGTSTAELAGYSANKFDGYATNPPQSLQPNVITINMGLLAPVSQATGLYLEAQDTFVEHHADTVQAVVNAEVEAWAFAHKYPTRALHDVTSLEAQNGITSPAQVSILFHDLYKFWKTPLMLRSAFINSEKVINLTQATPVTMNYTQWCASRFVTAAVKSKALTLGVKVPTSV